MTPLARPAGRVAAAVFWKASRPPSSRSSTSGVPNAVSILPAVPDTVRDSRSGVGATVRPSAVRALVRPSMVPMGRPEPGSELSLGQVPAVLGGSRRGDRGVEPGERRRVRRLQAQVDAQVPGRWHRAQRLAPGGHRRRGATTVGALDHPVVPGDGRPAPGGDDPSDPPGMATVGRPPAPAGPRSRRGLQTGWRRDGPASPGRDHGHPESGDRKSGLSAATVRRVIRVFAS